MVLLQIGVAIKKQGNSIIGYLDSIFFYLGEVDLHYSGGLIPIQY
jgi:hypothetical protein